ncbi:MAG: HEAT repeat domain-containing protein [Okeania sp. SIO2D1]|nr:HEAT repeat domain-containing protein [Okeania sp. SIO2D1]
MLKKLAESDDNFYVRRSAIQQLALGWHDDPGMFEFFGVRAYSDPFVRQEEWEDNPRQTALEVILEQYQEKTQIFQILCDRAENDLDEQVQKFALKTLKGF